MQQTEVCLCSHSSVPICPSNTMLTLELRIFVVVVNYRRGEQRLSISTARVQCLSYWMMMIAAVVLLLKLRLSSKETILKSLFENYMKKKLNQYVKRILIPTYCSFCIPLLYGVTCYLKIITIFSCIHFFNYCNFHEILLLVFQVFLCVI